MAVAANGEPHYKALLRSLEELASSDVMERLEADLCRTHPHHRGGDRARGRGRGRGRGGGNRERDGADVDNGRQQRERVRVRGRGRGSGGS